MEKQKMGGVIPILLIGFNRPDTMQQVFNAVRDDRPKTLYYAVDGARNGRNEEDEVQKVRDIIKQVDWPCEVHTLFRDKNVGCGFGPAEAITWAFKNEESLIVLEDDCVPSQSFFSFCKDMLERYKDDERVNIISGRSHHSGSKFFRDKDYIFTRYAHTWGWATWKRSWDQFDMYMKDVPDWLADGGCINIAPNRKIGEKANSHLRKLYNHIDEEVLHSWDSQWSFARQKSGALGIVPSHNLIHNIGNIGTHSFSETSEDMPAEEMPADLKHPKFVVVNQEYELYHYNHFISKNPPLIKKVSSKIKREGLMKAVRNYFDRRW